MGPHRLTQVPSKTLLAYSYGTLGPLRPHLSLCGLTWASYRTLWATMGPLKPPLGPCEHTPMAPFEPLCAHLGPYRTLWATWAIMGPL